MPEYAGLHISHNTVRAALVRTGGKRMEILDTFSAGYPDAGSLAGVLRECAQRFAGHRAEWLVGTPVLEFSVRHLSFPFKNRRAIASALPFEMESVLPYSAEEIETSFMTLASSREETRVLACAARKDRLAFFKTALKEAGIEARFITPDAAALIHFYRRALVKAGGREPVPSIVASVEGEEMLLCFAGAEGYFDIHAAAAGEHEIRSFAAAVGTVPERCYIGGEGSGTIGLHLPPSPEQWKLRVGAAFAGIAEPENLMAPVGLAMMGDEYTEELAFPCDEGRKMKIGSSHRFAAVGAACFAVLAFGFLLYRNYALQNTYDALTGRIADIYTTAVPGSRAVKPLLQMKQRLAIQEKKIRRAGLAGGGRIDLLWALKRLSETLPEGLAFEVEEITYDEEGVTLKGRADKFESVTRIKELYSIAEPFKNAEVTDSRASADGKKVSFKLRMQL